MNPTAELETARIEMAKRAGCRHAVKHGRAHLPCRRPVARVYRNDWKDGLHTWTATCVRHVGDWRPAWQVLVWTKKGGRA